MPETTLQRKQSTALLTPSPLSVLTPAGRGGGGGAGPYDFKPQFSSLDYYFFSEMAETRRICLNG